MTALERLTDLSPEQRRVLLAEAAGWKMESKKRDGSERWVSPEFKVCTVWKDGSLGGTLFPDFLNDLNACADLEAKLTDEQHNRFRKHLRAIVVNDLRYYWSDMARRAYVSSKPDQRASALILTLCPEVEL